MPELIGAKRPSQVHLSIANMPRRLCERVHNLLRDISDIRLVEPINEAHDCFGNGEQGLIDVVLVGSSQSTAVLLESIAKVDRKARVIVLTESPGYSEVVSLFRVGARGVLCSTKLNLDLLCKCIRCVHQGEIWASNEYLNHLVAFVSTLGSANVTDSLGTPLLSAREQQVLHLLSDGLTNGDLARALNLSEHTIKNHLFRIYDKLGVSTRMEAVLFALTPRVLPMPSKRTGIAAKLRTDNNLRIMKTG